MKEFNLEEYLKELTNKDLSKGRYAYYYFLVMFYRIIRVVDFQVQEKSLTLEEEYYFFKQHLKGIFDFLGYQLDQRELWLPEIIENNEKIKEEIEYYRKIYGDFK